MNRCYHKVFVLTEELRLISPADAGELEQYNTYGGQRNLKRRKVEILKRKMLDGRFHTAVIAIYADRQGNQIVMNGQHCLRSGVESGVSFWALVQTYTPAEGKRISAVSLAELFSQFDVDRSDRTRAQVAWVYANQMGMSREQGWTPKLIHTLNTALGWRHDKYRSDSHQISQDVSMDEQAELLSSNREGCEFVRQIMSAGEKPRHLDRAAVFAAIIETFEMNQKAAKEFWMAVNEGTELKKNDPRFKLREHLVKASVRSGSRKRNQIITTSKEILFWSITAWNAWRSGETIERFRYRPGRPLPITK